ncbi:hypothetical protein HMI54_014249 [Coelomomyces lativittatus]|nr:hypothetical protein HMI55_000169 [Coelomomyces lativittatus]KAJ1510255.1 hypothetical protein HMI56_006426 [Coelomomyces lativittatus]KAJ1518625.1 hypothetical protein HMI54_014249 [Coelomomyces lativittatus]
MRAYLFYMCTFLIALAEARFTSSTTKPERALNLAAKVYVAGGSIEVTCFNRDFNHYQYAVLQKYHNISCVELCLIKGMYHSSFIKVNKPLRGFLQAENKTTKGENQCIKRYEIQGDYMYLKGHSDFCFCKRPSIGESDFFKNYRYRLPRLKELMERPNYPHKLREEETRIQELYTNQEKKIKESQELTEQYKLFRRKIGDPIAGLTTFCKSDTNKKEFKKIIEDLEKNMDLVNFRKRAMTLLQEFALIKQKFLGEIELQIKELNDYNGTIAYLREKKMLHKENAELKKKLEENKHTELGKMQIQLKQVQKQLSAKGIKLNKAKEKIVKLQNKFRKKQKLQHESVKQHRPKEKKQKDNLNGRLELCIKTRENSLAQIDHLKIKMETFKQSMTTKLNECLATKENQNEELEQHQSRLTNAENRKIELINELHLTNIDLATIVEIKKDVEKHLNNKEKQLQQELQKNKQCKSDQSQWDTSKNGLEIEVSSSCWENDNLKTHSLSMHQHLETIQSKLNVCNKLKNQTLVQLTLMKVQERKQPSSLDSKKQETKAVPRIPNPQFEVQLKYSCSDATLEQFLNSCSNSNSNPKIKDDNSKFQSASKQSSLQLDPKSMEPPANQNSFPSHGQAIISPAYTTSSSKANFKVHFLWKSSWIMFLIRFLSVF